MICDIYIQDINTGIVDTITAVDGDPIELAERYNPHSLAKASWVMRHGDMPPSLDKRNFDHWRQYDKRPTEQQQSAANDSYRRIERLRKKLKLPSDS